MGGKTEPNQGDRMKKDREGSTVPSSRHGSHGRRDNISYFSHIWGQVTNLANINISGFFIQQDLILSITAVVA
jgi:hypothetical protein